MVTDAMPSTVIRMGYPPPVPFGDRAVRNVALYRETSVHGKPLVLTLIIECSSPKCVPKNEVTTPPTVVLRFGRSDVTSGRNQQSCMLSCSLGLRGVRTRVNLPVGHGTHVAAAVRLLNVFCSQGIHFSIESCADGDVALSKRRVPSVHGVHSLGLTPVEYFPAAQIVHI